MAGAFGGLSIAQSSNAFGNGARRSAMTEGLFPVLLRKDPRYFTKAAETFWGRTGYISREVVRRGDDSRNHFNTSEVSGNAVGAGMSNLYYPAVNRC